MAKVSVGDKVMVVPLEWFQNMCDIMVSQSEPVRMIFKRKDSGLEVSNRILMKAGQMITVDEVSDVGIMSDGIFFPYAVLLISEKP